MGLDMYLSTKKYFSKYNSPEKGDEVRALFKEIKKSKNLDSVEVKFEMGYWRKANMIHNWFVKNVQNMVDDCGDYYVSREDLEKLLKACQTIVDESKMIKGKVVNGYMSKDGKMVPNFEKGENIKNPETAERLLPTKNGCFFGGTEYDQYYMNDIKETIRIIKRCLKLPREWEFEYHSSW